jgi:hypothetical protein
MRRNAGFGEQGFDFQYCENQNFGESFEKPKISHFTLKLLWKKVTTMVGM